jgi:uncharacterized protein YndB with AHSA1/START domain
MDVQSHDNVNTHDEYKYRGQITMDSAQHKKITVDVLVNAPRNIVWKLWNTSEDIMQWNRASDDWHTTMAQNDLRPGGKFHIRMEAINGSTGFDLDGVYQKVQPWGILTYKLGDGRTVEISFIRQGAGTKVTETFEAEQQNPPEMQKAGWQATLNNFKKYAESNSHGEIR